MSDTGKTDAQELYDLVLDDLTRRKTWEDRQAVWFTIRHNGLRRMNKPWPGAADMHYPLADGMIEKFKPFYFAQLFATETLASFVSWTPGMEAQSSSAAYWYDFKIKQKSNLETEILTTIDDMLMSGRPALKIFWDDTKKAVQFDAVKPTHLIVPYYTKELQDADRITHVITLSEDQYRAKSYYAQDDALIKRIKGKGSGQDGDNTALDQKKQVREGITHGTHENEIVLWEVYSRDKDRKWQVDTISPLASGETIRKRFKLPFRHIKVGEEWQALAPFVDFPIEIKDKGYYSPRGIPEIVASFETSLCKSWNSKLDYMAFVNTPLFTSDMDIPNTANFRFRPGEIMRGIQPMQMPSPPVSFDEEMNHTRSIAEARVVVPDYGIGGEDDPNADKTATETNAIVSQNSQQVDLKARMFRKSLAMVHKQAWALLVQYDEDYRFMQRGAPGQVSAEVLNAEYSIEPNGSADSWNKVSQMRKAVQRMQLFAQNPYIDQGELAKSVLENDDAALVPKLYRDPKEAQQDQQKLQMMEIPALENGSPLPVTPSDDDAVHVMTLLQFVEAQGQVGKPVDPVAVNAVRMHLGAHVQQAMGKDPKKGKMLAMAVQQALAPHAQPEPGQQQQAA